VTDFTYKTDNQLIMLALADLLVNNCTEESVQITQELLKRAKEQRQHIPLHIRMKNKEGK